MAKAGFELKPRGIDAAAIPAIRNAVESPAARLLREQNTTRDLASKPSPASILRKSKIVAGERTTGLAETRALRREASNAGLQTPGQRNVGRRQQDADNAVRLQEVKNIGTRDAGLGVAEVNERVATFQATAKTDAAKTAATNALALQKLVNTGNLGKQTAVDKGEMDRLVQQGTNDINALKEEAKLARSEKDADRAFNALELALDYSASLAESVTFVQDIKSPAIESMAKKGLAAAQAVPGFSVAPEAETPEAALTDGTVTTDESATASGDLAGTITPAETDELEKIDAILSNPEKKKGLSRTKRIRLERKMKILDAKV